MAYSDKVIDHYENPRNVGSFERVTTLLVPAWWVRQPVAT